MPSSSSSSLLRYGLCAAAAALELAILVAAFRPDVTPAYAAFFIDRSTDCYIAADAVRPVRTGAAIDLSDGNMQRHCPLFFAGWQSTREGWLKTKSREAELRIRLEEGPPAGLALTLTGVSLGKSDAPQPVDLLVGDERVGTVVLTRAAGEGRVVIPDRLAAGPDLAIRMVPGRPEGGGRPRPGLAIGLTALRLDQLETADAQP